MRNTVKAALSYGALALALATTGVHAAEPSRIQVGISGDIRSTDPGVNRDENTDAVVMHMVEGLVAYREDATVGPMLAESVNVSDDGRSYRFTLREGVRFHNGAPLTAAEVLWTWRRYLDPNTHWRCLGDFDGRGLLKVQDISSPDPMTVVFTLEQPNALFLATMARTDCGGTGILHPDSLTPEGAWRSPVGTGPFKLGQWQRGQYVELQRFADYAARAEAKPDGYTGNKAALVDQVRFVVIPDNATAKAALMARGVDLLPDVTATDAADLKQSKGLTIQVSPAMSINGLLFQTRDPLLKDVRIRRAIALSLDYGQMVATLSSGLSKVNNSAVPSSSTYYDAATAKGYSTDLAEARALLNAAGYRGQPIKMIVNKRYPQMFDMGILSQAMLAAVGINIQMETLEWGTQLERYQSGNYQMMSFSYSPRFDPALSFEQVLGDKSKEARKVWDNADAIGILHQAMREAEPAKRQALFDQLHGMLINDVPMVIIYNGTAIGAFRDDVQGYRTWPISKPRLWGVSLAPTAK